jgi:hypothetical protein
MSPSKRIEYGGLTSHFLKDNSLPCPDRLHGLKKNLLGLSFGDGPHGTETHFLMINVLLLTVITPNLLLLEPC